MSVNLSEQRHLLSWRPFHVPRALLIDHSKQREPIRRYSTPTVTDDKETKFIAWAVILMAFFAITPLILFHIVNFFYPDLFWFPITPN